VQDPPRRRTAVPAAVPLAALGAILVWAYTPTFAALARRWSYDPQYSHGFLVPLFAAALLWSRRERLRAAGLRPSWHGLGLLALGGLLRLLGAWFYLEWLDAASLLPTLAGCCVLLLGWRGLSAAWPAIAFLGFMVPLPYKAQAALAGPLQHAATLGSTFALQTLGVPAVAEGNVILLDDIRLGVEDACSGLAMLVTFFALATAVAVVVRKPWTDRVIVVASAVPIALLTNVVRITVSGVLHEKVGHDIARAVFHDWAGWFMMPLALGLLAAVPALLSRLFVPRVPAAPPTLDRLGIARPAGSGKMPAGSAA
jgi:exosortase